MVARVASVSLGLPAVDRVLGRAVVPCQVDKPGAGFMLLKNRNDLFSGKSLALQGCPALGNMHR